MLFRKANAIKAWANAIKMPDQRKYEYKWISGSYKMFRRCIEIHILGFNYLKFLFMFADFKVKFVTFTNISNEEW